MSDQSEYAPAPWLVVAHNWQHTSVIDADGDRVCGLDLQDWGATEDNQSRLEKRQSEIANLIAAAPELLEALETIENDDGKIPEWLWERIQSAKAKAKGEAS